MNNNNFDRYVKTVKQKFAAFGMKSYLTLLALRNSERKVTLAITPVGQDGTSCTDGKHIQVTLWPELITKKFPVIKTAMETFTAHEAEHCRSSNFKDGQRCAELVGEYYNKKYGYNTVVGQNLGASLYNIVEDGRIERIAVNRFPGEQKGFEYINAILWEKSTLSIEEPNMYKDFMTGCLTLAKTGLKPRNWEILYTGQEADEKLNEIAWIIYEATCSNFTEDVVNAVVKINEIIDPFIKDALKNDSDLQDQLQKMAQDMSKAENDAATQAGQAGANGGTPGQGGNSINKPQGVPNSNSQGGAGQGGPGQGVGNSSGAHDAKDALDNASERQIDSSELEEQIENDENLQEEIDNRIKQNEDANQINSDTPVSQDELDKLGQNNSNGGRGLDFGNAKIEHFQQALEEESAYDVDSDIYQDGTRIYNSLKRLFMEKNDLMIKKLKKGRLDTSRLPMMVSMRGAGQVEDKLFYKIKKAVKVSCAAYTIVDTSGSTQGRIFNNSMDACAKIELGFGKLIPLKIAAYDSDYDFRFRVIRDFNNKRVNTNLSYNFKKLQKAGGGTPTAEAMALAGYELEKRTEKNKLLIVITDGYPDNNDKVKKEVHKLRKKGIKVVAILINDDTGNSLITAFNDMYEGRDVITENSENIAPKLIKLLTKWITSSIYK